MPKRSKTLCFRFWQTISPSARTDAHRMRFFFSVDCMKNGDCRAVRNLRAEIFRRPDRTWQNLSPPNFRKPNKYDCGLWLAPCRFFPSGFSLFTFAFHLRLPLLAAFREILRSRLFSLAKPCKACRKISRSRREMTAVWSAVSSGYG